MAAPGLNNRTSQSMQYLNTAAHQMRKKVELFEAVSSSLYIKRALQSDGLSRSSPFFTDDLRRDVSSIACTKESDAQPFCVSTHKIILENSCEIRHHAAPNAVSTAALRIRCDRQGHGEGALTTERNDVAVV